MQNRLWKDLTDRIAKEPFEGMYWGWGPKWVTFIQIDSPLTIDQPLWTHKESSLDKIRLFDLSPEQLQLEIIRYWQQPFWKRWLLSLFTAINNKIKLWSYYQRCLAVREACLDNLYGIDKPIDCVFEQYMGEELVQSLYRRLYRTTTKLDKYIEKYAGNLKFEKNDRSVDFYLRGNLKFFDNLMEKKLALLDIESKANLQIQLEKEFDRHEMMLFCYLSAWHEKVFDEPIYFDEPILLDTCVDPRTGKKMTYSTQSIEEWIKLKRQIFESMLQDKSPEQFPRIKNFLESILSTIKQLINHQLERYEKMIHKVRCERLAPDKAILQANILLKNLILFKKSVLLFHPDKSFGIKNLQAIQVELFKDFRCLAKESMEQIKQGLQTLEVFLAKQKNTQRIKQNNLRVEELEKIMDDLHARLDEIEPKLTTNHKETRQEVSEKLEQIGIEIAEMRFNYSDLIRPQSPLKLMFKPLNNLKHDEPNEQEKHEPYVPPRTRTVYTRRLSRYTPVF